MYPIPGNIIGVTNIVCQRRRNIRRGFAIRWSVIKASACGPKESCLVPPAVPERCGPWRAGHRMRRGKPSTPRTSRSGQCLVRDEHKRQYADRCDKRSVHFTGHGTYPLVGYRAALQQTLSRAFGAHKCIINFWLTADMDGDRRFKASGSRAWLIDRNICFVGDLDPALGFQPHQVSELLRRHGFGFGALVGEKPAEFG